MLYDKRNSKMQGRNNRKRILERLEDNCLGGYLVEGKVLKASMSVDELKK